ncbi:DUF4405 domain-containing protein [Desulfurobacterium atlanticum]|uniref:Flavinylation-associated cytochrome domain-containing protein n=1 Tax=Desulfurobacterium atlanticum TaxID=240169 RepID=A0A238Y1M5_9BACT|nr:DUF4405 domain-containing protein [Desulfurobacterium atlanticum]SNR65115.1 protein of unknown function [Desulfurobacterium atlanticum]
MNFKKQEQRKWIDLILFYSFLVLLISSIVLFIVPYGRVANWTGWKFFSLTKTQWENVHLISGIIFIIFLIWHIVLNWTPLQKYLLKKESIISLIVTGIVFLIAAYNLPPVSFITAFQEKIKESWEKGIKNQPPIPHAELMTLKEFCTKTGIPIETALKNLRNNGIKVESADETLKEIAIKNNTSPAMLYKIINKGKYQAQNTFTPGMGFGRKTVKEVCISYGLTVTECVEKLAKHNIIVSPDETLRTVAAKNGLLPKDIVQIIASQ